MPKRERTKHDLRCFCTRTPLLAVYGVDERGRLYVHQKVYKQGKVFGESFFYGGIVKIMCRECLRWNEVIFRDRNEASLYPVDPPEVLRRETQPLDSLQRPNDDR